MIETMAATSNFEIARLVGELLGIISVGGAGVVWIARKISEVLGEVREIKHAIGEEEKPHRASIRGQLKHQDECTDKLRQGVEDERQHRRTYEQRTGERLARIEGKLGLSEMGEE